MTKTCKRHEKQKQNPDCAMRRGWPAQGILACNHPACKSALHQASTKLPDDILPLAAAALSDNTRALLLTRVLPLNGVLAKGAIPAAPFHQFLAASPQLLPGQHQLTLWHGLTAQPLTLIDSACSSSPKPHSTRKSQQRPNNLADNEAMLSWLSWPSKS